MTFEFRMSMTAALFFAVGGCALDRLAGPERGGSETGSADPASGDGTETAGAIYVLLHADYTFSDGGGQWCDLISGNYADDNDAVPDDATFEREYGPSAAGSYKASFSFDRTRPDEMRIPFDYTLEAPPAGYARHYTLLLRDYDEKLHRCLNMVMDRGWLTYVDIKTP
jgi:hypothetical protein